MNTSIFKEAVGKLTAIAPELRQKFLKVADDLTSADCQHILTHLEKLNTDLEKNDQKYVASLQRNKALIQQVEAYDLPILDKLTNA
jgi:hypothetical protein